MTGRGGLPTPGVRPPSHREPQSSAVGRSPTSQTGRGIIRLCQPSRDDLGSASPWLANARSSPVSTTTTGQPPSSGGIRLSTCSVFSATKTRMHGLPPASPSAIPTTLGMDTILRACLSRTAFTVSSRSPAEFIDTSDLACRGSRATPLRSVARGPMHCALFLCGATCSRWSRGNTPERRRSDSLSTWSHRHCRQRAIPRGWLRHRRSP
jgi:hypothetical protein